MIAPEPYLSAYLATCRVAVIHSRYLALENVHATSEPDSQKRAQQIADLLDAIHVVLELLNEWERCEEPVLRAFLERYDDKWAVGADDLCLMQVWHGAFER